MGVTVVFAIINIPTFVDYMFQVNLFSNVKEEIRTIAVLRNSRASMHTYFGTQFMRLNNLFSIDKSKSEYEKVMGHMPVALESIKKQLSNPSISVSEIGRSYTVCEIESIHSDTIQKASCEDSIGKNTLLLKLLHDMQIIMLDLDDVIRDGNINEVLDFFASGRLVRYDSLNYYSVLTMNDVIRFTIDSFARDTDKSIKISLYLKSTFMVLFFSVLAVFRIAWLPSKVRIWKRLQSLFLIMNDDILGRLNLDSYLKR